MILRLLFLQCLLYSGGLIISDKMYFGGYNCPDCLRYVKEGFGLFRWKRNGEIERYCWNCHISMRIEEEE